MARKDDGTETITWNELMKQVPQPLTESNQMSVARSLKHGRFTLRVTDRLHLENETIQAKQGIEIY